MGTLETFRNGHIPFVRLAEFINENRQTRFGADEAITEEQGLNTKQKRRLPGAAANSLPFASREELGQAQFIPLAAHDVAVRLRRQESVAS